LSTIFVDFIFVDFDKILDNFLFFWGNYFLPTMPFWYGNGKPPCADCPTQLQRNQI
jgi:hypothetical protein